MGDMTILKNPKSLSKKYFQRFTVNFLFKINFTLTKAMQLLIYNKLNIYKYSLRYIKLGVNFPLWVIIAFLNSLGIFNSSKSTL